ncbi:MAG: ABC transporter ATP-binding protein [Rhodoferax sp.]|uniref:ABC transporter ATP-binding protein n=1 Tax=Rhodoferax sp. TaxID=50421 RepID=UPI003266127E
MRSTPAFASTPHPVSGSAANAPVLVHFKNVCKAYGTETVVNNVNVEIRKGEFLTLLGPSGSGKTTSLMMLAGFESTSSGSIEMEGRRIDTVPAHKRDIGVVFQNYALFPHMTIAENLAFPLQVRKVPKAEIATRVDAALEMVHLGSKGQRRPAQLSGGQQQRIALARAMIFKPSLIVLDEPLGALDKSLREQMQLELKRLHRELGITMVFVTHDQSEALTMSDRVAVFDKGRIQQIDTPTMLYQAPKTRFVAGFIGENNLIECTVASCQDGRVRLQTAGGGNLVARSDQALAVGSRVTFALRPEQIELDVSPSTAQDARRHVMSGLVRDVIFLGDQSKLVVSFEGIGEVFVRVSTRFGMHEISAGTTYTFSYWIELAHVFPSTEIS